MTRPCCLAVEKQQTNSTVTVAEKQVRVARVSGLDGLRGFAVLVVMLYHFFGTSVPGGFLGVDIFFVLSGFLITSLLIRERALEGKIRLRQFWIRRVRRILPAAITVLVICTIVAGFLPGDYSVQLGQQFLSTWFFANNWTQIASSQSYFAESGVQLFAHYWSLAVEEQFYVVWPLLFIVLARMSKKSNRSIVVWASLLAVLSFGLMLYTFDPQQDPTRVYYGTDTHSFGLLIGVALAALLTSNSPDQAAESWPKDKLHPWRTTLNYLSVLSLGLLMFMIMVMPDTSAFTYRGGLFIASFLTAIVIAALVSETGFVHVLLRLKVLRWLGERSFSLYLWHWPVVIFLKQLNFEYSYGYAPVLVGAAAFLVSLPLSHMSFIWIETPIRRRGYSVLWPKKFVMRKILLVISVVVAAALSGVAIFRAPTTTALEERLTKIATQSEAEIPEISAVPVAELADVATPIPGPQLLPTGDRITALGDSVMLGAKPELDQRFPGIYVDAAVSRTLLVAPDLVTQLHNAGALDPFVVLGFGTNARFDPDVFDQMMQTIGQQRVVIVVMPYGDRSWISQSHDTIRGVLQKYSNVYMADWCSQAQSDASILYSDGIHPNDKGVIRYTNTIENALQQWANHRRIESDSCN
ncbi:acyltransferase family protein [Corynebacterium sp. HS2168-gen11]|uniref:acyltransferase family protein n=1 Tax=Corynebacterium sp. HS2168-gen11 TaxID=2974027 RepID=UPI00216AC866|nr:acyltransferase family protein [Corynebacterium sp. HS2168-gen11]MCS4536314.1 acyltransferase family protein [Corynebacterium sp. HS2168-gen11]